MVGRIWAWRYNDLVIKFHSATYCFVIPGKNFSEPQFLVCKMKLIMHSVYPSSRQMMVLKKCSCNLTNNQLLLTMERLRQINKILHGGPSGGVLNLKRLLNTSEPNVITAQLAEFDVCKFSCRVSSWEGRLKSISQRKLVCILDVKSSEQVMTANYVISCKLIVLWLVLDTGWLD